MSIFNSLGSNYNLSFVLKTLFSGGNKEDKKNLEQLLEKKYGGPATLLYKGREALELALKNLNLPKNSFIAINGFTCFAVYKAIQNCNLNVEYLDIEKGQLNFSAGELEKHLNKNPKIRVVIIQNTLGYPCQIEQIARICKDKKIIIIEDLAHCVGTRYENGKEAGTIGNIVVLSFSQDKIIDSISGGALIKIDDKIDIILNEVRKEKQLIDKLYPLFTYIIRTTYSMAFGKVFHIIIKNLNLLSKPLGNEDNQIHQLPSWYCNLVKLSFIKLQDNLEHRRKIASIYAKSINPKITSPKIISLIDLSTNLRFPIFVNKRENLIKYLAGFKIYVSDIWYDAPVAPKKYLNMTTYQHQCPNAEIASLEIINLPTHINVKEKDAEKISQLINQWIKLQ